MAEPQLLSPPRKGVSRSDSEGFQPVETIPGGGIQPNNIELTGSNGKELGFRI